MRAGAVGLGTPWGLDALGGGQVGCMVGGVGWIWCGGVGLDAVWESEVGCTAEEADWLHDEGVRQDASGGSEDGYAAWQVGRKLSLVGIVGARPPRPYISRGGSVRRGQGMAAGISQMSRRQMFLRWTAREKVGMWETSWMDS